MEHVERAFTPDFLGSLLGTQVNKVSISMGSNHGDNYMCVLYGIQAELSDGEKRHLVVKTFPCLEARQQMLQMTNIFAKEYYVYHDWFTWFSELQEDAGKPNAFPLAVPKYISGAAVDYSDTPVGSEASPETDADPVRQNYLLMEDARKHGGFKMADRHRGLDAAHARLVLKELAKFHALGWCYKQKNNVDDLTSKYKYMEDAFFKDELMETFQSSFDILVATTRNMMKEAFGAESVIYQNFDKFMERDTNSVMKRFMTPVGIDLDQVQEYRRIKIDFPEGFIKDPWKLTCHGDCWVNNFLFRYNDDDYVEQVLLLDFQIMRDACPTTDLAYFLYTSIDGKTRNANLDEFFKVYHDSFMEVCNTLGYKPLPGFSLETLKLRFRLSKVYGMMIAIPLLFAVLKQAESVQDLDTLDVKDMGDIFTQGMALQDENSLLKERLAEIIGEMYQDGML